MKLWMEGNRILKVYQNQEFIILALLQPEKNKDIYKNNGKKTFLLKMEISVEFFTRHFLRRGLKLYNGPLVEPIKNLRYYLDYFY